MNRIGRFKLGFLPWIVLLFSLVAVYFYWQSEQRLINMQKELRFANACDHMVSTLKRRMQRYNLLLQGCKGLFSASATVTRTEFHDFVASLNIVEYCPGTQAVGFCRHVQAADLQAYLGHQRAEVAGFSVVPGGERPVYCPVEFIEPFEGVNTRVPGYDAYSETVRRTAFEQARDLGATVLSDRIMLVQFADKLPQPGLLLVAPVYARQELPSALQEKRKKVYGYVYVAIKAADYVEAVLSTMPADIALEIYDEQGPVPGALLYRSPNATTQDIEAVATRFSTQFKVEDFGRQWTVRFTGLPFFTVGFGRTRQIVLATAGLAVGILLWLTTLLVATGTRRLGREIAERKKAAEGLCRASQKWRAIFDAMLDPVALLDLDLNVQQCNRAFAEFVGLGFEELIGRKCYVLVHNTNAPILECPVIKTCTSMRRETWETQIGEKYLFMVADPVFEEDGSLAGIVHIMQDITRRRQAEEELRIHAVRQNALLAAIPDIVMEVDMNKIYTWANRPGIDFFGDDVLGREAAYYFETEQDTYQHVQRLFEGDEQTVYIESRQRRRDGEKRLLGWWCHVMRHADGTVRGALSTARDITDQKRMQEALAAKNRELESFVYIVSHDLRSPLISIRTYLGYLLQDIASADAARIEQDVDFINNAACKMNRILEELLQLSRIGRVAGPAIETSIQDLAGEALELVAGQVEQRGVRVQVCDEPVLVYGDRTRLVQVLQNLIDNAVKYMDDQSDPFIEIGANKRNSGVAVWVRDNGKGIERGCETKIFQIFERIDSRTEGVGIGLALVKRIIEVHGGRVWVESDGPGKGACFNFTLPVKSLE